jgi:hypothetical protein
MNDNTRTAEELWATLGPPELHADEAIRATKKLWRFATGGSAGDVEISHRQSQGLQRDQNGCLFVNDRAGWKSLVYSMASYLSWDETNQSNARTSYWYLRLTREVIKRKWLNGCLRDKPKAKQTRRDLVVAKLYNVIVLQKKWEAKQQRARNALKKLKIKRRYYENRIDQCG